MTEQADAYQVTVSTAEAAQMLMISEDWVRKLHAMGYFPKKERGHWDLSAILQGYRVYLKEQKKKSEPSENEMRLLKLRADKMEADLKAHRKKLVRVSGYANGFRSRSVHHCSKNVGNTFEFFRRSRRSKTA